MKVNVPLTVPKSKEKTYKKNFLAATRSTGNLMMFAADQKVEHLNDDFVGDDLSVEVADPEHYFRIAQEAEIGAFATQLGLLGKYAKDYPDLNYIVKLNSKTNILKKQMKDPLSNIWIHVHEVLRIKKQTGLNIVGVGYTIYLGSWYESEMFNQVAHMVHEAHQAGLFTVIWMYPRGVAVPNEEDVHLIAGAAGVATCLGADFVKVNYPGKNTKKDANKYREVVNAAGNRTGVICVGGKRENPEKFLEKIHKQKEISGTKGVAIGRNIYQRELHEAVRMANAVTAITCYSYPPDEAYKIFKGEKELDTKKGYCNC